jgi:hypothetical protein
MTDMHSPQKSSAFGVRLALVAIASWLAMTTASQAGQVALDAPLSSLLAPGAYAIVGTEEYSNFGFHASATNGGYVVQASDIDVVPYSQSGGGSGLVFQTPALFVANGQGQDVSLTFDVTELNPSKSITSMELMFDGASQGTGRASIAEVVDTASNSSLGNGLVYAFQGVGNNTTKITFVGQNTIQVTKDIALFSTAGTGNAAQVSDIWQVVDPGTSVPEPSTIVMMVFGGGGLGLVGWRRRRKG